MATKVGSAAGAEKKAPRKAFLLALSHCPAMIGANSTP